jgi:hypothetical protein
MSDPAPFWVRVEGSFHRRRLEGAVLPFDPWSWRDPAVLVGGYDRPDENVADDRPGHDVTDLDRPEGDRGNIDLVGYDVEATDGAIGSIDEAGRQLGAGALVVDTGPWIFGRKVVLPVGTVQRVDHTDRRVYVDRTKDQIKDAPEFDPEASEWHEYRMRVGGYYEESYRSTPPLS